MLQEPATVNWTVYLQTTLLLPRLQLGGKVFEWVYQVVGTYTKVSLRKMGHSPPSVVQLVQVCTGARFGSFLLLVSDNI